MSIFPQLNLVKCIKDKNDYAIYFSRNKLPFERNKYEGDFYDVNSSCQYWSSCKEGDEYAFIMTIEGEYYDYESRNFGVSCNVRLVADVE